METIEHRAAEFSKQKLFSCIIEHINSSDTDTGKQRFFIIFFVNSIVIDVYFYHCLRTRCLMSLSGHHSLEARRDRSSLLLFHKIHSGAVPVEKDKYLTPAHSLKSTRASHSAQYCR